MPYKNPEDRKVRDASRRQEIRNRANKWYADHREIVLDRNRVWAKAHRPELAAYEREYRKQRFTSDPNYRLRYNIRRRLQSAMKQNKTGSAVRDLGCTIPELKVYLENQFQPGMSWENYGPKGWHIDHVKPLASFDLTDRNQLLQACHYTNLQPLWWRDNLVKGDRQMPHLSVPAVTAAFAADGGATGSIQVSSSAGFYPGCVAYVSATGLGARVVIVSVPDSTHVVVRIVADDNESQQTLQRYGGGSNLSAYTTVLGASISMPAQLAQVEVPYNKAALNP